MPSPKTILSIQSEVVTGHVGNAAARFALQRLGIEAWGVPTVLLSSHAGHPGFAGEVLSTPLLEKLLGAMEGQGRLAGADGVLSGYLGSAEQAAVVAGTVVATKKARPDVLYCMDTAFGDDGRIYARPGVFEAMRDTLVPLADILTPNVFELATLTGLPVRDPLEAIVAAAALNRPIVVATSVPLGERLGTLMLVGGEALLASTPIVADPPRGTGDLFAALLFGHLTRGVAAGEALELAVRSTYHIISSSAGQPEMALIAEQEVLASPPYIEQFRLERLDRGVGENG